MTEYPEWLVDRVAKTMVDAFFDDELALWDTLQPLARDLWRIDARKVLDALGFAQQATPQNWQSALQREQS